MTTMSRDEYCVMLRTDLWSFVAKSFHELHPESEYEDNWHLHLIADRLEKCRRGETRRLIINVPPRSLKSHIASVSFPAFLLGHNPSAKIIVASYGQELAEKFASDCRLIMQSDWYQFLFPTRLASARPLVHDLRTVQNGNRLSVSVGGALTGRGGDFIIIDDPLKSEEAVSDTQRQAVNNWFASTLMTRLDSKRTGCIVLIMQRLHEDDLTGHLVGRGGWELLRLPAIAEGDESHEFQDGFERTYRVRRRQGEALHPARESLEELQQIRDHIGEFNFSGQYQQDPAPVDGGMVKREWLKTYLPAEIPNQWGFVLQSWDTANKPSELSDYSVCTTWGVKDKHLYLLDVFRRRLDYPGLKRAVRERAELFRPRTILIEDKVSGTQLLQELAYEGVSQARRYKPTMNKIMRLHSVSGTFENGFVHVPEKADWLAVYMHELTTFPRSKHDDQVDSTSQALDWMKQVNSGPGWVNTTFDLSG